MDNKKPNLAIAATFLWIGFVCAISFMESWIKFLAPGITVPLGLGIGRLVFSALNKVEWLLAIILLSNILFSRNQLSKRQLLTLIIPLVIILIQTFWLLPLMDARAEVVLREKTSQPSYLHIYFAGAELIKVICLTFFGSFLLRESTGTD
jgi:hypothetical protein